MLLPGDGQHPELPGLAQSRVSRRAREVWPATWGCRGLYGNKTMSRGEKTRRGEEGERLKCSEEWEAKARAGAVWKCRIPEESLARAGGAWGGFAEPHGSGAGKARADSKAHSKYIVPAELSLFNTHRRAQPQLTPRHRSSPPSVRVWGEPTEHLCKRCSPTQSPSRKCSRF